MRSGSTATWARPSCPSTVRQSTKAVVQEQPLGGVAGQRDRAVRRWSAPISTDSSHRRQVLGLVDEQVGTAAAAGPAQQLVRAQQDAPRPPGPAARGSSPRCASAVDAGVAADVRVLVVVVVLGCAAASASRSAARAASARPLAARLRAATPRRAIERGGASHRSRPPARPWRRPRTSSARAGSAPTSSTQPLAVGEQLGPQLRSTAARACACPGAAPRPPLAAPPAGPGGS